MNSAIFALTWPAISKVQFGVEHKWLLFFHTIGVATQCYRANSYRSVGSFKPQIWLPKQQTYVRVKQHRSDDIREELEEHRNCKTFAAEHDNPLLYILGEPQPEGYFIMLFPPRYNSRLYPKFTNARFGIVPDDELSLWLMQDIRHFNLAKIWNLRQLKHRKPIVDDTRLQQVFAQIQEQMKIIEQK